MYISIFNILLKYMYSIILGYLKYLRHLYLLLSYNKACNAVSIESVNKKQETKN